MQSNANTDKILWNISHDDSIVIKGIAIIIMFIHHICTDDFYTSHSDFCVAYKDLGLWCKICVPIFAFLSGWLYAKGKRKGMGYSIKKSLQFYFSYLLTFGILAIIAIFFCHWQPDSQSIFNEIFPIGNHQLMIFCWYAAFYPLILFLLAICDTIHQRQTKLFRRLTSIVIVGLSLYIAHLYAPNDFAIWPSSSLVGYYLSKSNRFSDFCFFCRNGKIYRILLYSIIALLICQLWVYIVPKIIFHLTSPNIVKHLSFLWQEGCRSGICDSIYVITLMLLINRMGGKFLRSVLVYIGKVSMNLWFLHCLFLSSVTREIFLPYITFIPHPLVSVVVLLLLCLLPALILRQIQQHTTKKIFHW